MNSIFASNLAAAAAGRRRRTSQTSGRFSGTTSSSLKLELIL